MQQNIANGTGSGTLAWYDINGNSWTVTRNQCSVARRDGFLVDQTLRGWENGNVFAHNTADVHGSGRGFRARAGNTVGCDNKVINAAKGSSDIPCRH